ncbi:hypothetical protein ZEAMMB73_Zm00001d005342 [Zea mays]|uniref:Uncharacterized protein n=1 Tax=Zea mays TaxID=4577 RepID=A0A1D6ELW1_MAIZE|nr:hypothetical protein ZEAMMB73_Zm00001d005342 [Zea mays]
MASPALLLPWARAPLPLQVSSNFGLQRTATPLSQLGLAITQGMVGAQKIHAAGPLPPCAQLSFLLRSISLPQAPARAQQRIPGALPCSSSLPHKTAAARPTSPRCAAPSSSSFTPERHPVFCMEKASRSTPIDVCSDAQIGIAIVLTNTDWVCLWFAFVVGEQEVV